MWSWLLRETTAEAEVARQAESFDLSTLLWTMLLVVPAIWLFSEWQRWRFK